MSADKYTLECHLTPTGWMKGTRAFYGKIVETISPPKDRVLTLLKDSVTACGIDPEEVEWKEIWRSRKNTDVKAISRLEKQFGAHPRF